MHFFGQDITTVAHSYHDALYLPYYSAVLLDRPTYSTISTADAARMDISTAMGCASMLPLEKRSLALLLLKTPLEPPDSLELRMVPNSRHQRRALRR